MELRASSAPAWDEPAPDEFQSRALAAAGHAVVVGPSGSGKTTLAVRAITQASRSAPMERLLLIAPTRQAAATLRDRVSLAVAAPTTAPVVRTAASLAFALLTAQAHALEEPRPALISGAEQDVVLKELLEGRLNGRAAPLDWATVPPEATALPGFRAELRNLLMRAAEADLSPAELRALGAASGRREWQAAADLYEEYESVMALRSTPLDQGARYDPATIIARAADALATWEATVGGDVPSWDLIVVDDFQDATAATAALLDQCVARGARLMLIGNADQAVQAYRGGVAAGLHAAIDRLGAERIELEGGYRQPEQLAAVSRAVAARIGLKGRGSARQAMRTAPATLEPPTQPAVITAVAPHLTGEARIIAAELRRARHGFGAAPIPWSRMMVIARSSARLRTLRGALLAADIPCESIGEATALHREPAVAPLLTMVKAALGQPWTENAAVSVLTSRLIGMDAVALRRLRRSLVRREREAGGARPSGELLVEALSAPGALADLRSVEAQQAARAVAAVAAAAARLQVPAASPGAVLWAVWSSLDLAERWREAALAGSARDDADLDAVIALMRVAQTFGEHLPGAHVSAFLAAVESQDIAADTLGARARGGDVVTFRTPASASGTEADLVVIAGLEEGTWPNLTLRDTVLGAQRLADALQEGLPGAAERASGATDMRSAREAVADDEARSLLVAVSRARRLLVATAVDDGETRPSRYLSLIESAAGVERGAGDARRGASDLRELVAQLRAQALARPGGAEALTLAHLAARGVPGAGPEQWHGARELSSEQPIWQPEDAVRVSPSKVESAETCALRWALESVGGTRDATDAQEIGTMLHALAEEFPDGGAELEAAFELRWASTYPMQTWAHRVAHERARQKAARLAAYLESRAGGTVLTEQAFAIAIDGATLVGKADRVELRADGAYVVDIKTGNVIPSRAEAAENAQLAMYQLAVAEGAFPGAGEPRGAELAFVSDGKAGTSRTQPPVDPERARERLLAVVEVMRAADFTATVSTRCTSCPLRRSCPAHAEGRQVSDA